jgi:V-type H+-transporting ATPase subunit a
VPLIEQAPQPSHVSFSYIAGTVSREEQFRFKKMIFRVTRGKAYSYFHDLVPEDNEIKDYTGAIDKKLRSIFVIVFQDGGFMRTKINKVCDSFLANSVEIPSVFNKNELNQK